MKNPFRKDFYSFTSSDEFLPEEDDSILGEDSEEKESQLDIEPLPFSTEDGELNVGPPNEESAPIIFRGSYSEKIAQWFHDLNELIDEPGDVKHEWTNLDSARPQHEYSMPTYVSDDDDEGMPVTIAPFPKGNKIFLQKLTSDGDLIGEMTLEPEPDGETWKVSFINVRKKYRGKGYAKELHDAADEWAKENNTWITPDYDISDPARGIWHKKRISPGYVKEPYQRNNPQSLRTHLDPLDVEEGEEYDFLDPVPEEYIPQELKYRYRRADHFQNLSIKELEKIKRKNQDLPEPTHKNIIPHLSGIQASNIISTFFNWFGFAQDLGLISKKEAPENSSWINDDVTKSLSVSKDQLVGSQNLTAGQSKTSGEPLVFPLGGGKFVILNGHHRIVNGIIEGQNTFNVRVLKTFSELKNVNQERDSLDKTADHYQNLKSMYDYWKLEEEGKLPKPTHPEIIPHLDKVDQDIVSDEFNEWWNEAEELGLIKDENSWFYYTTKVINVPIDKLIAIQEATAGQTESHGDLPNVWPYQGKYVIVDGHHRIISQILDGAKFIEVFLPLPIEQLKQQFSVSETGKVHDISKLPSDWHLDDDDDYSHEFNVDDYLDDEHPESIMDDEFEWRNT